MASVASARSAHPPLRFEVLGERVLRPFRAVRVPARVLWCNFELARGLGFEVPRDNRLDDALERKLTSAFSFRVLEPEDVDADAREVETVTLYADRYYGSGMEDHRGSARGGIETSANVFIKGIGRTPLAGTANPWHSNGACHISQCVAEALFGELDAQLFTAGATRVVAILDQHRTILFDGKRRHAAIVVRVGVPYRPAHLVRRLGEDLSDLPALFVRLTKVGGELVTRRGRPDYAATMRRLLALHARTAAEQVRWRLLHGAISTSNIGLFGEMIDLNSQATQARTAPISVQRLRRTREGSFGGEHLARATELELLYLSITESLSPRARAETNAVPLDCASELEVLYDDALETELLHATGLSRRLAQAVKDDAPELVRRYREVLSRLMALRNPGSVNARISTCERIGVVDVFRVLAELPRRFLADETADHRMIARQLADPRIDGEEVRRKRIRKLAQKGLDELADLHREIFAILRRIVGPSRFRSVLVMICERAELENRPMVDCFRSRFLEEASALDVVDARSSERLPEAVQKFLDTRIARNVRSVEAMLRDSIVRRRGGLETQRRVHFGVEHVLRSRDGHSWAIEIRLVGAAPPRFFHFSFDGVTFAVARVRVSGRRAEVRIPLRIRCGILEGAFADDETTGTLKRPVLPFVFAVPARDKDGW